MMTILRKAGGEPDAITSSHMQGPDGTWYILSGIEQAGKLAVADRHTLATGMSPDQVKSMGIDEWHKQFSRLWAYWIITPKSEIDGVRAFAGTAGQGQVPPDWTERPATRDKTDYVVCTFSLTMDEARALGSAQTALRWRGGVPDGVDFFQRVAEIDGFSGVEKESRQPDALGQQLYEPGELFQTSHPEAGAKRGEHFGEADVLSVTGLNV